MLTVENWKITETAYWNMDSTTITLPDDLPNFLEACSISANRYTLLQALFCDFHKLYKTLIDISTEESLWRISMISLIKKVLLTQV